MIDNSEINATHFSLEQFPQIISSRKRRVLVGIRPFRQGGVRIQVEQYANKSLVFNYGQGGAGVSLAPACAAEAVDLLLKNSPLCRNVSILGAGIIGLTTALQCANRGISATVYAERLPKAHQLNQLEMCTSQISPGYWNPTYYEQTDKEKHFKRSSKAYEKYSQWSKSFQSIREIMVFRNKSKELVSKMTPPELANHIEDHILKIGNKQFRGIKFHTYQINLQKFLQEVIQECKSKGVKFINKKFVQKQQILGLEDDVVVACLGLGSKFLFNDQKVYGIKGYLIQLENSSSLCGVFGFQKCVDLYCLQDKVLIGFHATQSQNMDIDPQVIKDMESNAYELYKDVLISGKHSSPKQQNKGNQKIVE